MVNPQPDHIIQVITVSVAAGWNIKWLWREGEIQNEKSIWNPIRSGTNGNNDR